MNVLNYDQVRSIIKDGDIVFVCGTKTIKHPVQAIIMLATGSVFVHVCIAFWTTIGSTPRLMCIESQGGTNCRILNLSYYQDRGMVVVTPPKDWNAVCDVALTKVAVDPYGYGQAAYVGLRDMIVRWSGIRLPSFKVKHQICSEFVADTYGLVNDEVSPGDLYNNLLNSGSTTR